MPHTPARDYRNVELARHGPILKARIVRLITKARHTSGTETSAVEDIVLRNSPRSAGSTRICSCRNPTSFDTDSGPVPLAQLTEERHDLRPIAECLESLHDFG